MAHSISLGVVVQTSGINFLIEEGTLTSEFIIASLARHQKGDWGDVCEDDAAENEDAVRAGERLLSVYHHVAADGKKTKVYAITEYDRSVTTVLLPEEYLTTMRWDIDKALRRLEPPDPETTMYRVLVCLFVMKKHGVHPTPAQIQAGRGYVWCLGLGTRNGMRVNFYGRTLRSAVLRAQKEAKPSKKSTHTSWGLLRPKAKPKTKLKGKQKDQKSEPSAA